MTIQSLQNKGRISALRNQYFALHYKSPLIRAGYGAILIFLATFILIIDPIERFTNYTLKMRKGSFVYDMWEKPTYEVLNKIWVFNYTNVPQYLSGEDTVLKVQEIGPFVFQETRTNRNMSISEDGNTLKMIPHIDLKFLRENSFANLSEIYLTVPNIALIAMSTVAADRLGFLANAGAYYSIQALGSKLFRNVTVEELLWGYDDPIVTVASRILPGWIDFDKIGIMDRFYVQRNEEVEMDLRDGPTKYSIVNWDHAAGIREQGFTDLNSSVPCNRVRGAFEGLMVAPITDKNATLPVFRRQACRVYPFNFKNTISNKYGFEYDRYEVAEDAFRINSSFACKCKKNCLPDGFVDVSSCYYSFPITLSKPHFLDVDPMQQSYFEGLKPDRTRHTSALEIEPTFGTPLSLAINIQVNVAVRMSPANTITKPIKDKVLPVLWLSLYCKEPPSNVLNLLWLRLVLATPVYITLVVLIFLLGATLMLHGFYTFWHTRLHSDLVETPTNYKKQSVPALHSNIYQLEDENAAKEAAYLLRIKEDVLDYYDMIVTDA